MKTKPWFVGLALVFLSAPLLADDDCNDPVANWQPRKHLRQTLEAQGWTVYRIKVDDGCYEVRGLAPEGYRVEASFAPASLKLMELEREEDDDDHEHHDDDDDDDREKGDGKRTRREAQTADQAPEPRKSIVKGRPSVSVE